MKVTSIINIKKLVIEWRNFNKIEFKTFQNIKVIKIILIL